MSTTVYFEKVIKDAVPESAEKIDIEFGTSSYLGPKKLYIRVGEASVLVGDAVARELFEKLHEVGVYLRYY